MSDSDGYWLRDSDRVIKITNDEALSRYLIYLRHFRDGFGKGEKKLYHLLLNQLFQRSPRAKKWFMDNDIIPQIGCWKDYFCLTGKANRKLVARKFVEQLRRDMEVPEGGKISLCAKWAPTESSDKGSNFFSTIVHTMFPRSTYPERDYRRVISSLRKKLNLIETKLVKRDYSSILYSQVPSFAMKRYTKAFTKHDSERFTAYLADLKKGLQKMNVTGRELNDLVGSVKSRKDVEVCDLVFQELLKKGQAFERNCLTVADVSGSMGAGNGPPINVSVGMALYTACLNSIPVTSERFRDMNIDPNLYKYLPNPSEVSEYQVGTWWSFSAHPRINYVIRSYTLTNGETVTVNLSHMLESLNYSDWDMNTDFEAMYLQLLDQEENYDDVIVISDMEFDACVRNAKVTLFEDTKRRFKEMGKPLPKMVFWNVNGRTVPVTNNETNTLLVSGYSPNILNDVMTGKLTTSEFMMELLVKIGTMFPAPF